MLCRFIFIHNISVSLVLFSLVGRSDKLLRHARPIAVKISPKTSQLRARISFGSEDLAHHFLSKIFQNKIFTPKKHHFMTYFQYKTPHQGQLSYLFSAFKNLILFDHGFLSASPWLVSLRTRIRSQSRPLHRLSPDGLRPRYRPRDSGLLPRSDRGHASRRRWRRSIPGPKGVKRLPFPRSNDRSCWRQRACLQQRDVHHSEQSCR